MAACKGESTTETPPPPQTPPPQTPEIQVNDEILNNPQFPDPDLEEKLKNLKPNANNQSSEPIELKGVNLSAFAATGYGSFYIVLP